MVHPKIIRKTIFPKGARPRISFRYSHIYCHLSLFEPRWQGHRLRFFTDWIIGCYIICSNCRLGTIVGVRPVHIATSHCIGLRGITGIAVKVTVYTQGSIWRFGTGCPQRPSVPTKKSARGIGQRRYRTVSSYRKTGFAVSPPELPWKTLRIISGSLSRGTKGFEEFIAVASGIDALGKGVNLILWKSQTLKDLPYLLRQVFGERRFVRSRLQTYPTIFPGQSYCRWSHLCSPLTTTRLAYWDAGFRLIEARISEWFAAVEVPKIDVSKCNHCRPTALDFQNAGIILHPLTTVADDPPVVHDDAGVSVRSARVGCDDNVSGRSLAHGHLLESFVMRQGTPKD